MSLEALLMQKVTDLPTFKFSPALAKALEMLDDPNVNFDKVAGVIAEDRTVSQELMKKTVARSNQQVQSVLHAVRLMGMQTVRDFIQSATSTEATPPGLEPETFQIMQGRVWKHCQQVAIACQLLAKELDYPNLAQAYTVGLFHDIGKAILNAYAFEEISQSIKLTQAKAISMFTAEDRALGFNHSYFGAKVLERWGLPAPLVEAVRLHHAPRDAQLNKRLVKILHLADVAVNCKVTGLPLGISLYPVDKQLLNELPFPKERLMEIAAQAIDLHARTEAAPEGAPVS